ncbi:MAG: transposase [Cyanobacteria bacterium P01_F01_bin.153]
MAAQTVLVLDNASFHKGDRIREVVHAAGCELIYLPPYSPDLNPIEQCWSWVKARVKRVHGQVGTLHKALDCVLAKASYSAQK